MNLNNKKMGSLVVMLLVILGLLYQAVYYPLVENVKETDNLTLTESPDQRTAWEEAEKQLLFWYSDDELTDYFTECAIAYYESTGVAVDVQCTDSLGYLETIYQTSIDGENYPDLYLAQNDSLEKAYLYGIAAKNVNADEYSTGYATNAVEASNYQGEMYGYPLYFDTPVFVYNTDDFAEPPVSLQAIIDYASENEMGNGVANLIEWNINDEFIDFSFVGNSFTFSDEVQTNLTVNTDEALFAEELTFLQGLAEVITIDASTMSRSQAIEDFNEGATASVIINAGDLEQITLGNYAVTALPALNDTLTMKGCAQTGMLFVNQFSEQTEAAQQFAAFVSADEINKLETLSGKYSVNENALISQNEKAAYQAYTQSANMPSSMDADDFWKELRQKIVSVWNGGAI